MSDFQFTCPHCQQQLSADPSMVGAEVACPTCAKHFILAEPAHAPPPPPPPMPALNEVGGTCPYCRAEITPTEQAQVCPACQTPHHADCWRENRGCTVFGCSLAPPDEERIAVTLPASAQTNRQSNLTPTPASPYRPKTNAPGAVASLVMAILGFFFCGLIFGIAAISNANKAKKLIQAQPDVYTGGGLATAGHVLGIIDLVAWALFLAIKAANAGT